MQQYTETFRARMVRRMLGPKAVTATELAQETGVSQPTLSRWLRETASVQAMRTSKDKPVLPGEGGAPAGPKRRAQDWTPEEKLRAVVAGLGLEGEALGAYLRRTGLHQEQLAQWQQSAKTALEGRVSRRPAKAERKRIKELERELRHKEKALAETAALLVLRKKANALWGDAGDDTDKRSDP
jgi:transposase-like protein